MIAQLETLEMDVIDRIVLYRERAVPQETLVKYYAELALRPSPLTFPEGEKLNIKDSIMIAEARETLRKPVLSINTSRYMHADDGENPMSPQRSQFIIQDLLSGGGAARSGHVGESLGFPISSH